MQLTEVTVIGVRSAVIPLVTRTASLRFTLFPMIHIGAPSFYRDVARRLGASDLIVAEGYDGPSSVGLAYRTAARWSRQNGADQLVHQDIDYASIGVPVAWPEKLFPDTGHRRHMPLWGYADLAMLVPYLTVAMALGGRKWLYRRHFEVDDLSEPRLRKLDKTLRRDRDDQLLTMLAQIYDERHDEDIEVAIVYGAAHLPTVVQALASRYGYRTRRGAEWITAIQF